jgi:hypothetical protein
VATRAGVSKKASLNTAKNSEGSVAAYSSIATGSPASTRSQKWS